MSIKLLLTMPDSDEAPQTSTVFGPSLTNFGFGLNPTGFWRSRPKPANFLAELGLHAENLRKHRPGALTDQNIAQRWATSPCFEQRIWASKPPPPRPIPGRACMRSVESTSSEAWLQPRLRTTARNGTSLGQHAFDGERLIAVLSATPVHERNLPASMDPHISSVMVVVVVWRCGR